MLTPELSKKEFKRVADGAHKRLLRDGVAATFNQVLEAFSSGFGARDWNTMSAALPDDARGTRAEAGDADCAFRNPDRFPFVSAAGGARTFRANGRDGGIDLVLAPPGRGKSILLCAASMDFCTAPPEPGSRRRRPARLSVIDAGNAFQGLFSMLRNELPPDRKHEVCWRGMRNRREDAVNPFDTALGFRFPDPLRRDALIRTVCLLTVPRDGSSAEKEAAECLVAACVDAAYSRASDCAPECLPNAYRAEDAPAVGAALASRGIALPPEATWWWCVDALFRAGDATSAALAQRHAVPRMENLVFASQSPVIRDIFGSAALRGDEQPLIEGFARSVTHALSTYPVLIDPTRLDLGGARVACINIDGAAPGGAMRDRQTPLFYLLARHALASGMMHAHFPHENGREPWTTDAAGYCAFHQAANDRLAETPRRLVLDDLHRAFPHREVNLQVKADMREGLLHGFGVTAASQMLSDFDGEMSEMAAEVWLAGVNPGDEAKATVLFKLSGEAASTLGNASWGTSPGKGAPFLSMRKDQDGRLERLVWIKPSAADLWGFASGPRDAFLRDLVCAELGGAEARRRLGAAFPAGSAYRRLNMRNEDGWEAEARSVAREIAAMDEV